MKLELDASAKDVPAIKSQPNGAASLTTGKKATATNWFQEKNVKFALWKALNQASDQGWLSSPFTSLH